MPAAALGQLGDRQGITLWACTYTYLAASMELLHLMWGMTSVQHGDVSKCLTDFCFNNNKKKKAATFDIILSELLIQSAVTPVCCAQHTELNAKRSSGDTYERSLHFCKILLALL